MGKSSLPLRRDGSNRRVDGLNGPSKVVGIDSPPASSNGIVVTAISISKGVGMMNDVDGAGDMIR